VDRGKRLGHPGRIEVEIDAGDVEFEGVGGLEQGYPHFREIHLLVQRLRGELFAAVAVRLRELEVVSRTADREDRRYLPAARRSLALRDEKEAELVRVVVTLGTEPERAGRVGLRCNVHV